MRPRKAGEQRKQKSVCWREVDTMQAHMVPENTVSKDNRMSKVSSEEQEQGPSRPGPSHRAKAVPSTPHEGQEEWRQES